MDITFLQHLVLIPLPVSEKTCFIDDGRIEGHTTFALQRAVSAELLMLMSLDRRCNTCNGQLYGSLLSELQVQRFMFFFLEVS